MSSDGPTVGDDPRSLKVYIRKTIRQTLLVSNVEVMFYTLRLLFDK